MFSPLHVIFVSFPHVFELLLPLELLLLSLFEDPFPKKKFFSFSWGDILPVLVLPSPSPWPFESAPAAFPLDGFDINGLVYIVSSEDSLVPNVISAVAKSLIYFDSNSLLI